MPHVRGYRDSDKDAVVHVYRETAHHSVQTQGDRVLELSSFMFCRPYLMLEPENAFVLDDDTGTAVGYIVGALNTEAFFHNYVVRFIPYLQSLGIERPHPPTKAEVGAVPENHDEDLSYQKLGAESKMGVNGEEKVDLDPTIGIRSALYAFEHIAAREGLHPSHLDLMSHYPSHLHIDILPAFQGHGHGRALIEVFNSHLHAQGSRGVQVIIAGDNVQGEAFYRRVGFGRFDRVLDGGKSGEIGRDDNQISGVNGHVWLVKDFTGK